MSARSRARALVAARPLALAVLAIPLVANGALAVPLEKTERVSVGRGGTDSNSYSDDPSISRDGRFIAFVSPASNLLPTDTNGLAQIFVYDRQTATTVLASADGTGAQGNAPSGNPVLSSDGRYVAFDSLATNLVANDANGIRDVFVRDLTNGKTTRVSLDAGGAEKSVPSRNPVLSADGRYVAFETVAGGRSQIEVYDRTSGDVHMVSIANDGTLGGGDSRNPSISGDGRWVAFQSSATNLVDGDTNHDIDIFVHDRDADANSVFDEPGAVATERVSVTSQGAQVKGDSQTPSISADGRYVAFASFAAGLASGDTNRRSDIYVHDRVSGATVRISVDSNGVQSSGSSYFPTISADGRVVVFQSAANDLVTNDTNAKRDVFMVDRDADKNGIFDEPGHTVTRRVSVDSAGNQANDESGAIYRPMVSADGLSAAFGSSASNLVANDLNGKRDVFVHDVLDCAEHAVGPFPDASSFAAQQFMDFLGHTGDAISIDFWSTGIACARMSPADEILGLIADPAFDGRYAPLVRLYQAYFLRAPHGAGLFFWVGLHDAGTSLGAISNAFAASQEFRSRYGLLSNQDFVRQVFLNVLGREPAQSGLDFWTGKLDRGEMTRGDVMLNFSEGTEFKKKSADEVFVILLYVGMLRRTPTDGELAAALASFQAGSHADLVLSLLASPEYAARFP